MYGDLKKQSHLLAWLIFCLFFWFWFKRNFLSSKTFKINSLFRGFGMGRSWRLVGWSWLEIDLVWCRKESLFLQLQALWVLLFFFLLLLCWVELRFSLFFFVASWWCLVYFQLWSPLFFGVLTSPFRRMIWPVVKILMEIFSEMIFS